MADGSSARTRRPKVDTPRDSLNPPMDASTKSSSSKKGLSHLEVLSRAVLEPFQRKRDSARILTDLAPVLMTPRMMTTASSGPSKPRQSIGHRVDFASLGRAPMRMALGTKRITSTDLQVTEATEQLLAEEIPEPEGIAQDVSLLRGFNATIPSSEKGKTRRRQTRNVNTPHMGLKRLGMNARGLLMEDGDSELSEDDLVVVGRSDKGRKEREKARLKGKRKARESFGATVALGKEELTRQTKEIMLDKENLHVRRTLINSEISEISHKIDALNSIRDKLEHDLLRLQEEELELEDELEGVRERIAYEDSLSVKQPSQNTKVHAPPQSSRRRKGPTFLPSEHDDLPPGVAFLTLSSHHTPITALDFSEPYGTLVTASSVDNSAPDDDGAPRVWDLLTVEEIGRLRGHVGTVKTLQVEDHVCLTGGEDGTVRVWDLRRVGTEDGLADITEEAETETDDSSQAQKRKANGDTGCCARVLEGHSKAVTALYFEENCLVTGASDKTLRQWDLTTGQCVMTMDILWALHHSDATNYVDMSSMGSYAPMQHFSMSAPQYADPNWENYEDFVGGVQFWGHALVSGSGDGAVRMWDMRTGQSHRSLLGHTAPVTCLQFDELHIISGSLDKTIRIWDLRTGATSETIKYDGPVTALQFDSRKVVAAAGENGVKIFNRTSSTQSSLITNGHTGPVERLRYMDRYLVSGGRDTAVKIWAI